MHMQAHVLRQAFAMPTPSLQNQGRKGPGSHHLVAAFVNACTMSLPHFPALCQQDARQLQRQQAPCKLHGTCSVAAGHGNLPLRLPLTVV
jgi:hypothetical protein